MKGRDRYMRRAGHTPKWKIWLHLLKGVLLRVERKNNGRRNPADMPIYL